MSVLPDFPSTVPALRLADAGSFAEVCSTNPHLVNIANQSPWFALLRWFGGHDSFIQLFALHDPTMVMFLL